MDRVRILQSLVFQKGTRLRSSLLPVLLYCATVSLWQLPWWTAQAAAFLMGGLALWITVWRRSNRLQPTEVRSVMILLLVGYAFRVAVAWAGQQQLEGDSQDFYWNALGKSFLEMVSWPHKTPGYLAFIWLLSKTCIVITPRLICLVQCLVSSYSIWQVYWLARQMRGPRTGWIAGVLATGFIPWIEWCGVVVAVETFEIALALAVLRRLVEWLDTDNESRARTLSGRMGALIGGATYWHAMFLSWLVLVPLLFAMGRASWRGRLMGAVRCVAGGILVLLPLLLWRCWTCAAPEIRTHWFEFYQAARYPALRIRQPHHFQFMPAGQRFPDDSGQGIGARLSQTLVSFYELPPHYHSPPFSQEEWDRRSSSLEERLARHREVMRGWGKLFHPLADWYGIYASRMLNDRLYSEPTARRYLEQVRNGVFWQCTWDKLLDLWSIPSYGALGYAYYHKEVPRFYLPPWWIIAQHHCYGLLAALAVINLLLRRGDRHQREQWALLTLFVGTSLLLVIVHVPEPRYTFCILPILILAAADGLRSLLVGKWQPQHGCAGSGAGSSVGDVKRA